MATPVDSGGGRQIAPHSRRRKKREPAPRPSGVFGGPSTASAPLRSQQRQAQQRTQRAQRALPKRPMPHVPILKNPTPRQTRAAQRTITNAVNRQLGNTKGAERQARRDEVYSEILTDPRQAPTRRAIRHYARAQAEHEAAKLARQYGVRGQSRAVTVAAGRVLQARGFRPKTGVQYAQARPGAPHTRLRPLAAAGIGAGIDLTSLGRTVMGATSLSGDTAENRLVKAFGGDVKSLAEAPFIGGYSLGKAVVSDTLRPLRHPNARRSNETGATVGALLKGVAENTKQEITHPGQAFSKHPLLTALDVAGAASIVGRTAGAAARGAGSTVDAAGVRGALARVGSTARSPIATSSDAGAVKAGAYSERKFSKDLGRKMAQALSDSTREPVRDAHGNVVTVKQRGREVPVLQAHPGERDRALRREANFRAARANARERTVRDETAHATHVGRLRGGVRGDRAKSLVAMVMEGTITSAKHFEEDVAAEAARLKREYAERIKDPEFRHSGEADAARHKIELLEGALTDPKVLRQKDRIVAEGVRQGAAAFEREGRAQAHAMYRRPQHALDRARMTPTLVSHLGGRYHSAAEHAALEAEARVHERAAEAKLKAATTPADRMDAAQELLAAREERIAVSGRDPERVRAHEDAVQVASEAKAAHQSAQAAVARLHAKRQRLIGAQSSRRGSRAREVASLPSREEFIAQRPRPSHDSPIPSIEGLTTNLKETGRAGIRIEDEHVRQRYRDGSFAGWGPALGGSKSVVARDSSGRVIGVLRMTLDERGKADVLEIAVDPAARGRGIASRLYDYAEKRGYEVEAASGRHGLTEAGAALKHKRLSNRARATRDEARKLAKADAEIKAAKRAELEARKARGKAEQKLRQTPMPEQQAGIRAPGGRYLSTKEATDFLESRGRDPRTVGYLPHRMDVRGRAAHHTQFRPGTRPVLDKPEGRTGEAQRKGTTESSADVIRDAGMRIETQIVKAEEIDSLVRDHGIRHPAWAKAQNGEPLTRHERDVVKAGGFFGGKEATELAQRIEFDVDRQGRVTPYIPGPGGEKLTPMRAHAGSLSESTRALIREDMQGPAAMESLGQHLLNDRIVTQDELAKGATRNVVLVPTPLIKQMEAHLRPAGEIQKMFQMINRPFRFAVLAQPRWLTGNFVEPYFVRLPASGSGVINVFGMGNDIRIAGKIVKRGLASKDPAIRRAAQEIAAQQFGGLFIGARGASNRRAFADSKLYGQMVAKVPATRQMAEVAHKVGQVLIAPGRAYFWANRAGIEQWAQRASFGRQARHDMQEFYGSWTRAAKFGKQAADDALKGLVNTPAQRRFMESQHEMLGQYEGFGPRLRAAVQGPMPFLPWALSAARFVYWTMPVHHTALTAFLIKVNDVVSKEWQAEHSDTPPGSLRLAPRTSKGGYLDLARYTPYGLTGPIAEGDVQVATDQFLPQFSSTYAALGGRDPFDRELMLDPSENKGETKANTGQRIGIAAYGLAEALIPYLATARRLREHGGTAYAGSTLLDPDVKPGSSHMSAFRRTFDPFRPTYLRAPSSGGKSLPAPKLSRLDEALARIEAAQNAQAQSAQDARLDAALERLSRRIP